MASRLMKYRMLLRQYGLGPCLFRVGYAIRRRFGTLKRKCSAWQWDQKPYEQWIEPGLSNRPAREVRQDSSQQFFFPLGKLPHSPYQPSRSTEQQAQAIIQGRFRYFSWQEGQLGFPEVDWFSNPFTSQRDSAEQHWCDRGDFSPDRGDIKYIWEPARFQWVFPLVRAYAAEGRSEYAEAFWKLVESWMRANAPQMGPGWQCGQEAGIRIMSCVFGLYAFWDDPASTEHRVRKMTVLLAAMARRIEANIDYALSQLGNHAVTEAAGLWTVGLLLPELKRSGRWRQMGRRYLESEARRHNWDDGSYVMHSFNYQRMTQQCYLWCMRLGELNGHAFSDDLHRRISRSCEFLYQLQDPTTGRLPNYGSNDGAVMFPLDDCEYLDYRPALAAAHFLTHRERLYDDGPWQESLSWFFGPEASKAPLATCNRDSREFPVGGYYTLRGNQSWAMVRCHTFKTRPSQADLLHLDLWWKGLNVLRDSGSFQYYDPEENFGSYFLSTAAHNTVWIGQVDQMTKGPRFMWLSLAEARLIAHRSNGEMEYWQGEHTGYAKRPSGAVHRRAICRLGDGMWIVVDDIMGQGSEQACLRWNLNDAPVDSDDHTATLQTDHGPVQLSLWASAEADMRIERGKPDHPRGGWDSLNYGRRDPAPTISFEADAPLPLRFITVISLGRPVDVTVDDDTRNISWTQPDSRDGGSVRLTGFDSDVMVSEINVGSKAWRLKDR